MFNFTKINTHKNKTKQPQDKFIDNIYRTQ